MLQEILQEEQGLFSILNAGIIEKLREKLEIRNFSNEKYGVCCAFWVSE